MQLPVFTLFGIEASDIPDDIIVITLNLGSALVSCNNNDITPVTGYNYGTDLTQRHTREWHALESNLLSTKISSIHHRVRVDVLVKYV